VIKRVHPLTFFGTQLLGGATSASSRNVVVSTAVVYLLAYSVSASGQQGASSVTPAGLEEVVVTSQKREENLQDVPIAVTAVDGVVLAEAGLTTQATLPRITPGLNLNQGAGFTAPFIRGKGTVFATLGLESSVATYLDDQYLSRPVSGFFSFSDIARVEVLKGPQGTLYGRNAAGGAIRLITNDPSQDYEAKISAAYGRFDTATVDGLLNVPLSPTLSARVSARYGRSDSYVESVDPDHGPTDKTETLVRAKLLWEPTSNLTAKLSLDYGEVQDPYAVAFILIDKEGPGSIGLVRGGTPSPDFYTTTGGYGPNSSKPNSETDTFGAQLRFDLEKAGMTLSSISGYRTTSLDQPSEQDATEIPYSHARFAESADAFSQEFQVVSAQAGPFKWIAGLYYYQEKGDNDYRSYGQTINDAFGLPYGPTVGAMQGNPVFALFGWADTEATAPYAEATYELTDRWSLTAGARYTWETKTMVRNNNVVQGLGPDFSVFQERDKEFDFSQFTPKATISYKPVDEVLLYLTYSRGFKSGGFSLPSASAANDVDAEILDSYEFGYKTQFGRIRLNGSVFYDDYQGLQVQRPSDSSGVTLENAANATIYGADLETVWAATDDLDLGVGFSYLKTEYKDYLGTANVLAASTQACADAGGPLLPYPAACLGYVNAPQDFSGAQMINAPEFTAYGRLEYRSQLAAGNGSLLFSGLVSYSDRYFYNPEQSLQEPEKTLVSGSVTWTSPSDRYSISVFGDNLLDEKYDVYKTITIPSGSYRIPGAPVNVGIRLGMSF
jgi:iron complex outermembrane recepter protein